MDCLLTTRTTPSLSKIMYDLLTLPNTKFFGARFMVQPHPYWTGITRHGRHRILGSLKSDREE